MKYLDIYRPIKGLCPIPVTVKMITQPTAIEFLHRVGSEEFGQRYRDFFHSSDFEIYEEPFETQKRGIFKAIKRSVQKVHPSGFSAFYLRLAYGISVMEQHLGWYAQQTNAYGTVFDSQKKEQEQRDCPISDGAFLDTPSNNILLHLGWIFPRIAHAIDHKILSFGLGDLFATHPLDQLCLISVEEGAHAKHNLIVIAHDMEIHEPPTNDNSSADRMEDDFIEKHAKPVLEGMRDEMEITSLPLRMRDKEACYLLDPFQPLSLQQALKTNTAFRNSRLGRAMLRSPSDVLGSRSPIDVFEEKDKIYRQWEREHWGSREK